MTQVSGVEVRFSGNTADLEKSVDKAQGVLSNFAKTAAASLAAALSTGAFVAAGKAAINFADQVGKAAQKVGSSTKALSELEYAARLADVSFTDLETAMRFLSRNMAQNNDLFQQLGIRIKDAKGEMLATDVVLTSLADVMARMPDGATKTALAMELLGRGGASMIPFLNAGADGLMTMRKRAEELGLSISEDTAKRAEQFNDTITDLAAVGRGAMMKLASATLPVAQAFLNVSVAGAEAMTKLGDSISTIAPYAAIAVAAISGFYAPSVIAGIATTSAALSVGLVGAIRAVTVAMMANPLGLLVAGIVSATAALFAFRDDVKATIGVDVPATAKTAVNFVIRSFMNLMDVIKITFNSLGDIVGAALVGMSNTVLRSITALSNKVIDALNHVVEFANKIPGVTISAFQKLEGYEFPNVFAEGAARAGQEIGKAMAENAATDYVGKMTELASSVNSKVQSLFSAGDTQQGGNGTFNPELNFGAGGNAQGNGGETAVSPVPGVSPSQEVDAFFLDRLQSIRDGFKSEREILTEEYIANLAVLQTSLAEKAITEQEYYDLSRKLAEQHQADLASIQQQRLDNDLSAASSFFSSMASVAQSGGKRMIKIQKAMAAAQAIIDTIRAAVHAMNDPTAVTPLQKFANYAMVFAKGMSAVAAIKGVSEGGGGGGGRGGGGGGSSGGGDSRAAGPTTTFQFTLTNDPMGFGEKFARQFIDQLNATQRNGGQIRGVIA